ncbi:succinate dehydrogenase cytochrome b560 subunit, mitochondrial isoform X1 [Carassius auratus]|uniref:Succinate dehydrogenase cytochrome b560 subunit, mitochondrial n=2 Tax=Carassius auratus TaxID=7957 RepID=A0A6P6JN38_CARAU|nr:succinate dehydrogenase cytochrome b560 subunit, mitochondrial-like isoform X1 [Carassius auratus]
MALLLRTVARQGLCLSRSQFGVLYRPAVPMGTAAKKEINKFWAKNTQLNRPVSPHISIYKWSVPMMMSISHRGTGVALSSGISVFALAALVLPESYPYYLDLIHSMTFGPQFFAFSKFALAFPVAYHSFNGIRHLAWDLGKGFKIPEVYRSGYIVIALTVLTSIGLAAM